eukprot:342181_1
MNKGTRNTTMMILAGNTINDKKEIVRDSITINNNETVKEAFKNAMTKALSRQPNTPAKICLFLECDQFYEFKQDIHQHFVGELAINDKYEIITWDAKQNRKIQDLAKNYAIQNKIGMQVWRDVFDQLIQPPLETSVDVGNIVLLLFPKKQEEEKENEEFNSNEINPFFINKLYYCILMEKWVGFSAQSKQITACNVLIDFVQDQLQQLNKYMSSHGTITIKCLQFLSKFQEKINQLANDSQYKKQFKSNQLNFLVDQLNRWSSIGSHFINFLAIFTRKDEDYIIEETLNFTDFIKNWEFEQFRRVKARSEWKDLLYKYEDTLRFLYDNSSSNVFCSIWYDHRADITKAKWNFKSYFKDLYPNVMKTWTELIIRATESKLTFNDTMWFKRMDLETELNIMKIPKETIAKTQKDIKDSLQFKAYTDFVGNLIKMVDMLIVDGMTKINLRNKDETWQKLKQRWGSATQEKCEKSQNISIPAELNRKMRKYVGVEFDDLHLSWINTAAYCKDTLYKMATDDHFHSESWESTLDLLQDSTDGEITQLCGSLRSVHRILSTIWCQKYNSKTELMRSLAKIDLKLNDLANLLQVHAELPRVDILVAEVSKTAAARDTAKLRNAISNGYFKFDTHNKIQQYIEKYDDLSDIVKQSIRLNEYTESEIQGMIDIILLCQSNYKNKRNEEMKVNDDDVKYDSNIVFNPTDDDIDDEKEDEKEIIEINVDDIIRKYEICKEISELRVKFVMNGGRISENIEETIKASSTIDEYNHTRQEWSNKLNEWNKYIMKIRNGEDSIHLSNYFSINNVRLIIQKLNKYKANNQNNNNELIFQELS